MKELSNCCKCQAIVDSSDEGTNCYVCSACKKACDLFFENETTHLKYVTILQDEYERIKRLDENVKNMIFVCEKKGEAIDKAMAELLNGLYK
jgi:hypothetical protein